MSAHETRRPPEGGTYHEAGFSWVVVDTRTETVVAAVVEPDEKAAKAVAGLFNLRTVFSDLGKAVETEYAKRFCTDCNHTKHTGVCSAPVFADSYGRRDVVSTCECQQ